LNLFHSAGYILIERCQTQWIEAKSTIRTLTHINEMEALLERPMTGTDRDPDLILRVAAGDEDALRSLVAVYGQRLYAYALRLCADAGLADEIVQDSLVAVWEGAARFRGDGRVIAWLLGIVHHKAMRALRGRTTLSLDELDGQALPQPLGSVSGPDEGAARSEVGRLVRAGLERLSLPHRTVLELVFYQGLSLQEAADVLSCPLGTVKSRLSYAREALRGELSRAGMGAEDLG
jgi:RNA polymerase sigma-70 factor, ECF subfamily